MLRSTFGTDMERLSVLLILAALPAVLGFPRECVQNVTSFPVKCCPKFNGSECGAAFNRGNCMMRMQSRSVPPEDRPMDFRYKYPSSLFNPLCECKGNFYGPSCAECKHGFTGDDCQTRKLVIRPDFAGMNETERVRIFSDIIRCSNMIHKDYVMMEMANRDRSATMVFKNVSYYHYYAHIHYLATLPFYNNTEKAMSPNYAHRGDAFCCWHTVLLLEFERGMQKCTKNPNWAIPYWRWERDPDFLLGNNDYLCESDLSGNLDPSCAFSRVKTVCGGFGFSNSICLNPDNYCEWPSILRFPGHKDNFPKPTESWIKSCVALKNFTQMVNCIEGCHNNVHLWFAGTMLYTPISASDLVFYFHHANVDRICQMGIRKNKFTPVNYTENGVYGHGPNDCAGCFYNCNLLKNYLQNSTYLGYNYSPDCSVENC